MIMIEKGINVEIKDTKLIQSTNIGIWNEYVANILQERDLVLVNKEEISKKIIRNNTIMDLVLQYIIEKQKDESELQ